MVRKFLIIIALIATLSGLTEVSAQTRLRTEWGLVAGGSYPITKFDMGESTASIKHRIGWQGGLHMALKFGNTFAIQPEIIYTYAKVDIKDAEHSFAAQMKTNTLQIPVLFSLRFGSVFRLNAGPVLTVMDNPTYNDHNGEKVMFGRLYPTVSYAVGIGLCLWRHFLIDLRAMSRFNTTTNYISYDSATEGREIKSTIHNVQLRIGYLF